VWTFSAMTRFGVSTTAAGALGDVDDGVFVDLDDLVSTAGAGDGKPPLPLATTMPGVFAAGDVRHGSVKRVASAVGDGGVSVRSVHQYLTHLREKNVTGATPMLPTWTRVNGRRSPLGRSGCRAAAAFVSSLR
jgi:hypothetical protein